MRLSAKRPRTTAEPALARLVEVLAIATSPEGDAEAFAPTLHLARAR